ncbi:MAG: Ig-like domain-containing protein, partial [Lachnospiraceae bacterium]|nr:Ig-like domain-containing protein [Lachnospiraceae bacterium]
GGEVVVAAKKDVVFSGKSSIEKTISTKKFNLLPKLTGANSDGKMSFKSSNKKVVTVSKKGVVTIKGFGKAKITVTTSATDTYKKGSKKINITIIPDKVKGFKVTSPYKELVVCEWKADKKVKSCRIEFATDKAFKNARQYDVNMKKKKYQVEMGGLQGKKCYVRISSFVTVNGKAYYSKVSKVISVKVK